jgi:hypothetical protein
LFTELYNWFRGLFDSTPVHLAIVRRYADANGNYVGELYVEQTHRAVSSYGMVGASLDSLALDFKQESMVWGLDTRNDFLAPLPRSTVRVGAFDPRDNDSVRKMVAALPRHRIKLVVQNRFIEHVLEKKA